MTLFLFALTSTTGSNDELLCLHFNVTMVMKLGDCDVIALYLRTGRTPVFPLLGQILLDLRAPHCIRFHIDEEKALFLKSRPN